MKIYIQTDIEGCAGYCFYQSRKQTQENLLHYHRMCRLLTNEVNAAIEGAFAAGAAEVLVNDNHGSGYNIFFEELDPRAEIIHGRNCSGPHWLPLFDSSVDALVLIGMHAMAGTLNAVAAHSRWEVNNGEIYMGEGSMAAAIAGDHNVPTVFASGDDKVTAELREKIPELHIAQVKQSISAYQAKSLIPARAQELIRRNVERAINERDRIPPYRIPGPVTLQLYDSPNHVPPLQPQLPEPVTAPTIDQAFMEYEERMSWSSFNTSVADGFEYP